MGKHSKEEAVEVSGSLLGHRGSGALSGGGGCTTDRRARARCEQLLVGRGPASSPGKKGRGAGLNARGRAKEEMGLRAT